MIQQIIQYPDTRVRLISANVRFFNDELKGWIADMIDTMKANDLDALSAILIGIQYNVIVIRENGEYVPYINARVIKQSDKQTFNERSIYYPGITADVDRFAKVTAIYEDEEGNAQNKALEGEAARQFQEYLDYSFGSTFVDRVDREMKQKINDYLEYGLVENGGSCPTVFYRDYFKRGAKYLIAAIALSMFSPFFVSETVRLWIYRFDLFAMAGVIALLIGYFFYAQYEARVYKQCTSCQTGNIIGTSAILLAQLAVLAVGVFFWVAP